MAPSFFLLSSLRLLLLLLGGHLLDLLIESPLLELLPRLQLVDLILQLRLPLFLGLQLRLELIDVLDVTGRPPATGPSSMAGPGPADRDPIRVVALPSCSCLQKPPMAAAPEPVSGSSHPTRRKIPRLR